MLLRPYLLLAAIILIFRLVTALPLERAGYMDASYTLHVGANLARGRGLVQDIVWNYLDEPKTLPEPSNLYWLPLPSFLAAASMMLFGISYRAAQLPFIFLSLVPPLFAFYLARRIYQRDDYAWLAGLLTAFSGFYTIYWVSPDNFTPFAVTADLALLFLALGVLTRAQKHFLIAGICIGFAQLARNDALLLMVVLPILLIVNWRLENTRNQIRFSIRAIFLACAGALVILLPWLIRNWLAVGTLFAPGGTRALWLLSYDEFFSYDVARLSFSRYLDWGIGNILQSKFDALVFGILVLLFGVWQIFLVPFAIVGFWKTRWRIEMQAALIYLALLVLAMAFVFTFPAMHGSMLHSATALVTYGAVAVPSGLDAAIGWVAKWRRSWNAPQAQQFFRAGTVVLALGFSLYLYVQAVWIPPAPNATTPLWNDRDREYQAMDQELDALQVPNDSPIITVDPPSFINQTGRRSIYLPTESIAAIFDAARQFGAHYLVLQFDKPATLHALYDGRARVNGLIPLAATRDAVGHPVTLFEVQYK
ncbi:MAG TPA: glycosyltransferase family 39 protein [Anaerolineae bacterium]|nr:glycosyltransferase family 39 protein [Anaerolineae bacterium]